VSTVRPAWVVIVPLGLATWFLGSKQVAGMKALRVIRRVESRLGSGESSCVGAAEWAAIAGLLTYGAQHQSLVIGVGPWKARRTRDVTSFYNGNCIESEYHEARTPAGVWVEGKGGMCFRSDSA